MVHQEFYSPPDLATVVGCSQDTIRRDAKKMRALIQDGIYSASDFCGTHIRLDAYLHYRNSRALLQENPKHVKPFYRRCV